MKRKQVLVEPEQSRFRTSEEERILKACEYTDRITEWTGAVMLGKEYELDEFEREALISSYLK